MPFVMVSVVLKTVVTGAQCRGRCRCQSDTGLAGTLYSGGGTV